MARSAISKYLSKLGRKGAKVRAQKMTPERRKEVARNAAQARWQKQKAKNSALKS